MPTSRAHYAAMTAKASAGAVEADWIVYDLAYVRSVGVDETDVGRSRRAARHDPPRAAVALADPRIATALDRLAVAGVPMGVVSNASGQIEAVLSRETCQVGPGRHVAMRVIVDSHVVGVMKPDPAIFDHALPHFAEFDRGRIAYVGDSVTMDIASARGAGLHPILVDPYDDHPDADFERINSLTRLADELTA